MPWLKVGDKFAAHPLVLAVRRARRADGRSVNEVVGFLTRCATSSAGYMTDYRITIDVAELYGGARTQVLLTQAVEAGLLVAEGRGANRTWRIVEDEDLYHVRAKSDVEWERQRDSDRRNVDLIMPVLARDGDQCRYCRNVVHVKDTRSGRGRTFDHTEPGRPATVDTYVVACHRCNSKLAKRPRPVPELPLLAPPPLPYFSPRTTTKADVEYYFGHPIPSAPTAHLDHAAPRPNPDTARQRPGTDTATARPTVSGQDTAATSATLPVDADPPQAHPPPPEPHWTTVEQPWSSSGRRDGTGRDGSGRVGAGAPPACSGEISAHSPEDQPPSSEPRSNDDPTKARRRRGRRGKRGGGS